MSKKVIRLTEGDLHRIITESVNNIVESGNYVNYHKNRSAYDNNKEGNGETQPLKDNASLYDIRTRIPNIMKALKNNQIDDAKKQLMRLYKLVDAMINQGF